MEFLDLGFVVAILIQVCVFLVYVSWKSPHFLNKRKLAYFIFGLVMSTCAVRELALQGMSIPFVTNLSLLYFFNQSEVNYAVAIGCLLIIGIVRQLHVPKVAKTETTFPVKRLKEDENPFLAVFKNLKLKEKKEL